MSSNYYKASSFFYNMFKFQGLDMIDPENSQDMINIIKANSCRHCFMFGHNHLVCPKLVSKLYCIHCQKHGHTRLSCHDYNKKYLEYVKTIVPPTVIIPPQNQNPTNTKNNTSNKNIYTPPNNNTNSNNNNQLNDDSWNGLSDEEKKKILDDDADNFNN